MIIAPDDKKKLELGVLTRYILLGVFDVLG